MIEGRSGAAGFFSTGAIRAIQSGRALALALACGCAAALAMNAAHAASATPLEVRDIQVQARHTFSYTCANGKTFKVTYLNAANGQSFALVPVSGRKLLFVGVHAREIIGWPVAEGRMFLQANTWS